MAVSGELISAVLKDWADSDIPPSSVAEELARAFGATVTGGYVDEGYLDCCGITGAAIAAGVEAAIDKFDGGDFRLAVGKIEDAVREQLATQAEEIATSMLRELAEAGKQELEPEPAASA